MECPKCIKDNKHTTLKLYHINFTEAIYMCPEQLCTYPKETERITIQQNLFNTNNIENDSTDSDIETITKIFTNHARKKIRKKFRIKNLSLGLIESDKPNSSDDETTIQRAYNILTANINKDAKKRNEKVTELVSCDNFDFSDSSGDSDFNFSDNLLNSSVDSALGVPKNVKHCITDKMGKNIFPNLDSLDLNSRIDFLNDKNCTETSVANLRKSPNFDLKDSRIESDILNFKITPQNGESVANPGKKALDLLNEATFTMQESYIYDQNSSSGFGNSVANLKSLDFPQNLPQVLQNESKPNFDSSMKTQNSEISTTLQNRNTLEDSVTNLGKSLDLLQEFPQVLQIESKSDFDSSMKTQNYKISSILQNKNTLEDSATNLEKSLDLPIELDAPNLDKTPSINSAQNLEVTYQVDRNFIENNVPTCEKYLDILQDSSQEVQIESGAKSNLGNSMKTSVNVFNISPSPLDDTVTNLEKSLALPYIELDAPDLDKRASTQVEVDRRALENSVAIQKSLNSTQIGLHVITLDGSASKCSSTQNLNFNSSNGQSNSVATSEKFLKGIRESTSDRGASRSSPIQNLGLNGLNNAANFGKSLDLLQIESHPHTLPESAFRSSPTQNLASNSRNGVNNAANPGKSLDLSQIESNVSTLAETVSRSSFTQNLDRNLKNGLNSAANLEMSLDLSQIKTNAPTLAESASRSSPIQNLIPILQNGLNSAANPKKFQDLASIGLNVPSRSSQNQNVAPNSNIVLEIHKNELNSSTNPRKSLDLPKMESNAPTLIENASRNSSTENNPGKSLDLLPIARNEPISDQSASISSSIQNLVHNSNNVKQITKNGQKSVANVKNSLELPSVQTSHSNLDSIASNHWSIPNLGTNLQSRRTAIENSATTFQKSLGGSNKPNIHKLDQMLLQGNMENAKTPLTFPIKVNVLNSNIENFQLAYEFPETGKAQTLVSPAVNKNQTIIDKQRRIMKLASVDRVANFKTSKCSEVSREAKKLSKNDIAAALRASGVGKAKIINVKTIHVIKGKNNQNPKYASKFEGFKFHTQIIKKASPKKEMTNVIPPVLEKTNEREVSEVQSPPGVTSDLSLSNIQMNESFSLDKCNISNLDELLNDIDLESNDLSQQAQCKSLDDVDDWLKSLVN